MKKSHAIRLLSQYLDHVYRRRRANHSSRGNWCLKLFKENRKPEVVLQLHKRTALNGTVFNEFHSLFAQFECPRPSTVINNGFHNNNRSIQSQPVSSRTINKILCSHSLPSKEYDVIHPECNFVVDSAIIAQTPNHFTEILISQHASY